MTVEKRFRISLDIKRSTSNRDFEVVEGDNGNLLEVTLTDDGVPVDLTGCRVSAIFSKSDGHTAEQNTDGSGITLDPQQKDRLVIQLYNTSVAPGLVECELQVFSGEGYGTLVTSAKFNFMCRRGIANADTIKSTDEWPLLTGLIQQVRQMEEQTKVLNTATAEAAGAANAAAGTARELQQAVSLAELERREQEEARILNETARDVAEEDRELAEQERQELSSVATMAANTAAEQAKTAADRANAAAEAAEDIVIGALPKHAHTHAKGGTDEITPAMIGAASLNDRVAYNLLDNSDFTNPVNQRDGSEYSGTNSGAYCIDRWKIFNGVTVTLAPFTVTGGVINQYLSGNYVGIYTLAAKRTDGTVLLKTGEISNAYRYTATEPAFGTASGIYRISLPAGAYVWAALYEGEYTEETLPKYIPKGYGVEIAKCHRYLLRIGGRKVIGTAVAVTSSRVMCSLFTPQPMRDVIPSLIKAEEVALYGTGYYFGTAPVLSNLVIDTKPAPTGIAFTADVTDATKDAYYHLILKSDDAEIAVSAEL